jgi:hypothetical protein
VWRPSRLAAAIVFVAVTASTPAQAALLSLLGTSTLGVQVGQVGGERTVEYPVPLFGPCPVTVTYPALQFQMNQPVALVPLAPGGGFVEPAGLFTGTLQRTIPQILSSGGVPQCSLGVNLNIGTTIAGVSNDTKSIAPGAAGGGQASGVVRPGGGLGGPGPLAGAFIINVLGLFNLDIPLSVVGSTGASDQNVLGSLFVTVLGTGWTTGSVQLTGVTTAPTPYGAFNVNTVTSAGYDNRTPGHVGRVLLVSPFKVITNAAGNLPGIARQTLDFGGIVPEPGVLGLLVVGAAGLAIEGRRRMRR